MRLYHYVHCPFCVRVRMVLSFLQFNYESIILPYDDEQTPVKLTGVKMLPIMHLADKTLNESLQIIKLLDQEDKLKTIKCLENYPETEIILNKLGNDIHSLAMPYFIWTPEFTESSRNYFQKKKEQKRGPFKELIKNRSNFESSLEHNLKSMESKFQKEINSSTIDLNDILFASHLWAMYIVPEFQFPSHIHQYLQAVKHTCNFDYHGPYWS